MSKHLPELLEQGSSNAPSVDLARSSEEVIGIIAIHKSLGYLTPMGNRQLIRGVGASRRTVTGVILADVAVLLIAWGCNSEPTPSAEVVAAGDIASCRAEGDEATAELVEGIEGTLLALGDEAYPEARRRTSRNATIPRGGGSRGAPSLSPATTSTTPKGPETTSSTSVRLQATLGKATTPTSSGPGTW